MPKRDRRPWVDDVTGAVEHNQTNDSVVHTTRRLLGVVALGGKHFSDLFVENILSSLPVKEF